MLKKSDIIVFLGDSITELGGEPDGYVTIVIDRLREKFGDNSPRVFNAGKSGDKVTDLQVRLDRDVISKHPTIVFIYIGINDVWHFSMPEHSGTHKDAYSGGLEGVIGRIVASGGRVVVCTPTVIGEKKNASNPQDTDLNEYAEISRRIAKRFGGVICDLHEKFLSYLSEHNEENKSEGILTVDGVHLNKLGNLLVADAVVEILTQQ